MKEKELLEKKGTRITLRLSEEMADALKMLCHMSGNSLNKEIVELLSWQIQRRYDHLINVKKLKRKGASKAPCDGSATHPQENPTTTETLWEQEIARTIFIAHAPWVRNDEEE